MRQVVCRKQVKEISRYDGTEVGPQDDGVPKVEEDYQSGGDVG